MRAYWRVALQAVEPIGKAGTPVKPLALATVTPVAPSTKTRSLRFAPPRSSRLAHHAVPACPC